MEEKTRRERASCFTWLEQILRRKGEQAMGGWMLMFCNAQGKKKAHRKVKLDLRQKGWKGKLPDNLTNRWQGKCNFCQMASSSVFYSLNKNVALACFEQVCKMRIVDAQGLNRFCCWCFFPNTSTWTFREHRARVNPYDFVMMLSFDKIVFNFILSCFKTQPFCFHVIAAMQQLSALQQAS